MNPNQDAAFKLLEQAQQALKSGDKNSARQFAEQAAQIAPELEEVWLIMAALTSPHASVAYLEKALQINPQSERAKKGLIWAQGRLQQEVKSSPKAEQPVLNDLHENQADEKSAQKIPIDAAEEKSVSFEAPEVQALEAINQPTVWEKEPELAASEVAADGKAQQQAAVPASQNSKALTRSRYSYMALLFIFLCFVGVWAIWQGVIPVAALIKGSALTGREHGPAWSQVNVAMPDATQPAPEPTVTPTATDLLPAPTATLSILPTATFTPRASATSTPSNTALPTETVIPTEVAALETATVEVASAELASPTPLPTDTAAPFPTQYIYPTPKPGGVAGAYRWIDVDLSNQMVYAYEGNTVVNSFLVSTGTWQHPTVTGQYNIYVKYLYKNMSGPGYYLPDVPYTMFFYEGYAIHGTYWHSNFGTPMSHGCVNMSIPDSQWIYNFASVGTLVNVHY